MGKTIFITEKPSVAQEYRKVLNVSSTSKTDGYIEGHSSTLNKDVIITWAIGHLIAICTPEQQNEQWAGGWRKDNLPMIPKKFKYAPLAPTLKQFQIIKGLYTRADIECIYYAGDSGREGIYIQALIRNKVFDKTPNIEEKVVWIDSFTEEAILKGIKDAKPYSSYLPMIESGYMRAISDWLIGMNFTQAFSVTSGNTTINVGRVMTPTLAMIVNRQNEIDNFKETPYFTIKADNFANWKAVKGSRYYESDLLYNETGFLNKHDAEDFINELNQDRTLTVSDVKINKKTEYAPYLFNLADLQAMCTKRFHLSPAQTLEVAQSLYEKKFTTYPRTDCRFLSSAVATDLRGKGYNIPDRYVDDSKVTDHYALIPTLQGNIDELNDLELKVYNVIYKRFADTMLPPFIYNAVSVIYKHTNKESFFENYRLVIQLGFKEQEEKAEDNDEEELSQKPIPVVGAVVNITEFNIRETATKPPVPYTTGSLILAMEKAGKLIEDEELREQIKTSGIGTSATRAGIIEKLKIKSFITVDKKQKIAPTDFGKSVIPLVAKFDEALISPVKTADMENRLNAIANNEISVKEYYSYIKAYVANTVENILANNNEKISNASQSSNTSQESYTCPCCGDTIKQGKFGWFCPACKFNLHKEICGSKMGEKDIAAICSKGKTPLHSFTSKAGKPFKAYLVLDKEKKTTNFEFQQDKKK